MTFEHFDLDQIPQLTCLQQSFSLDDAWQEFQELIQFDRGEPRYNHGPRGQVTSFEIDVTCRIAALYSSMKTIKASSEEIWMQRSASFTKSEGHKLAAFFSEHIITPYLQDKIFQYESLLEDSLGVDHTIDWDSLAVEEAFDARPPKKSKDARLRPEPSFAEFEKKPNLFQRLFGQTQKILDVARDNYLKALEDWKAESSDIEERNHQRRIAYEKSLSEWEARKTDFEAKQAAKINKIKELKDSYFSKDSEAIEKYCSMILANSRYPTAIDLAAKVRFQESAEKLVVEIELPALDEMPSEESCSYIKVSNTAKCKTMSERRRKELYDSVVMQICIRTLHEIFAADKMNAIHSCAINGYLTLTDKATGQSQDSCVVTVQCEKQLFESFDLSKVDPKECFKKLKGINGIGIKNTVAVAPTAQLSQDDRRFVDNVRVVDFVREETNLAAMDWEEFEHLVRELFEKEFANAGSEVRVTQASADGGVDAIVFDPDPIRGGKVVIQAKRYTNTVGVSAVRDLYGTLMNEGAMKGILVTTSDFGPDSHAFANDKPLTLINGANLLHLLAKHGHQATIDLEKAKLQRDTQQT